MNVLQQFQDTYKSKIDIYQSYETNFQDIITNIYTKLDIDLHNYKYDFLERKTTSGYKMKYHRDNHMLRTIHNVTIFIPFQNSNIPIYTLIWYRNNDFTGGSLEFLSKTLIKPKKDLFVFFDSNDIHRVNEQLSGTRIAHIYKFYL